MGYSNKTTLDYRVGDIVYYKLNNTTIVQGRFMALTSFIFCYNHNLHFYTSYDIELADGGIITERNEHSPGYTLYASVEDLKQKKQITTHSQWSTQQKFTDKIIKEILSKDNIEYNGNSILYYTTGTQVRKVAFDCAIFMHGQGDTKYKRTYYKGRDTLKEAKTMLEYNKKGIYATKKEAEDNSNINIITFDSPVKEEPRNWEIGDFCFIQMFDKAAKAVITSILDVTTKEDGKIKKYRKYEITVLFDTTSLVVDGEKLFYNKENIKQ